MVFILVALTGGLLVAAFLWNWHQRRTYRRYTELGAVAMDAGLYDAAEKHFHQAFHAAGRTRLGREDSVVASLTNLAIVHKEKGDLDGALQYGLQSVKAGDGLAPAQGRLPITLDVVGDILDEAGRPAEAVRYREAALELRRHGEGAYSDALGNGLAQLGLSLQLAGRHQEAAQTFQEAIHVWSRLGVEDRVYMAGAIMHRGLSLAAMGQFSNAEYSYKEALALQVADLGEDNLEVSNTYNNLGLLYSDFARFPDAMKAFKRALEIRMRYFNEDDPAVARIKNNLSQCLRRMNQLEAPAADAAQAGGR